MSIAIRSEVPSDISTIRNLTKVSFSNAPHTDHTEQLIIYRLRTDDALTMSLVAEDEGELVGHVAASPVSISDGTPDWYGIGPISVLPSRQRQGIGSLLMNHVLKDLEVSNAAGVVLLGDPGYYGRFGFRSVKSLELAGVPPEYFQVMYFSSSRPRGVVTYHHAFTDKG